MKNSSLTPKGKTKSACVNILWLVLFFVLAGFVEIQAQPKETQKKEPLRVLIKEEHRENFQKLKEYLKQLRSTTGNIKIGDYSDILDSLMAIGSRMPVDATKYKNWQGKKKAAFQALDANTQASMNSFISTLVRPCHTFAEMHGLGVKGFRNQAPLLLGCFTYAQLDSLGILDLLSKAAEGEVPYQPEGDIPPPACGCCQPDGSYTCCGCECGC